MSPLHSTDFKEAEAKKSHPRHKSELQRSTTGGERANLAPAWDPRPPAIITPRINLIDSTTTTVQSYCTGLLIFIRFCMRKNGLYDPLCVIYVMCFNSGSWQKPDNSNLVN